MTLSTSAVAVCCCRAIGALRSSLSSRVFSMAMTAWAAKFVHQLDLLVGEGTNFLAVNGERTDQFVLLQHRDSQKRPYAAKFDSRDDPRIASFSVSLLCRKIGDVNDRFGRDHATDSGFRIGTER